MIRTEKINFVEFFLYPSKIEKIVYSVVILLLLPVVFFLVYITGGIKFVYSHSMYFPIILASLFWGIKGGLFIAFAGGIILGPFMPIDVITGEKQVLTNWIYRLLFFTSISGILGFFKDKLKQNIERLRFIVTHDERTGLLNTTSLLVDNDIKKLFIDSDKEICVISLVWKNYQDIINMFGFEVSTEIILELAKRIHKYYRDNYKLIQSGNSSFYIFLEGDNILFVQNQIQHLLDSSFMINKIPFYIEFAIGSARYDASESSDFTSLQKASIASTHSQKTGIPSSTYDDKLISVNKRNLLLLGEFPNALKNNNIILYYQPKIDLKTNKMVGMEALVRWLHPEIGLIRPLDFLPIVEESNLIHQLTESVLLQSLEKCIEINNNKLPLSISINISPKDLTNPKFLEHIISLLDKYKIETNYIEFEITESSMVINPEKVISILNSLKHFKISLSIDDFGTGYSSLAYLSRFPIDYIKIDQFFVKNIYNIKGIDSIIKATIDLTHDLGFKVIAEGIEDEKTESKLIEMGCDIGQGYLYSKPLPDSEILTFSWKNV